MIASAAYAVAILAFAAIGALLLVSRPDDPERALLHARIASFLFAVLVLARAPNLLLLQRLWAESGNLYFIYAYTHGPWSALVRTVSNYFDLTANIASATAVVLGLKFWPAVDTVFGYLPPLLIPAALAGLRFAPRQRMALMLALAAALYCIDSGEGFGTMLHAKGVWAVYGFLALLGLAQGTPPGRLHKVLLVLIPLTGPSAAMLFIIFGAAVLVLGRIRSWSVLAWTLPGLAVQLLCALLPGQQTGFADRPFSLDVMALLSHLLVVKGFVTLVATRLITDKELPGIAAELAAAAVVLALLLAALRAYVRQPKERDLALLVPVQIAHFFATALLALGGAELIYFGGGYRYYFPAVCMAFCFLTAIRPLVDSPAKYLLVALFALVVVRDHRANKFLDSQMFALIEPSWNAQLRAQEGSATKHLMISPVGWSIDLPACGEHYCAADQRG